MRGQGRNVAAGIAWVLVVAGLVLFLLFRGGEPSDEQAIREWFSSPAGGAASSNSVEEIHVPACNLTGYRSGSQDVLSCELQGADQSSLGRPSSSELRACFVISNGEVLRGGRQVRAVGDCKALRYGRTHGLVDVETGRHYAIE